MTDEDRIILNAERERPVLARRRRFASGTSWLGFGALLLIALLGLCQLYVERTVAFRTALFPAFTGVTAQAWESVDGRWQANVYLNKRRQECRPQPDQTLTALVRNPDGRVFETSYRFLADDTPESSRPTGWQPLDDGVRFLRRDILAGAVIEGVIFHLCSLEEEDVDLLATPFGPLTVGEDMPLTMDAQLALGLPALPAEE
ncbi:MAG: hypothetical protein AAFR84_02305 [Pseudomonadota bacterium]